MNVELQPFKNRYKGSSSVLLHQTSAMVESQLPQQVDNGDGRINTSVKISTTKISLIAVKRIQLNVSAYVDSDG